MAATSSVFSTHGSSSNTIIHNIIYRNSGSFTSCSKMRPHRRFRETWPKDGSQFLRNTETNPTLSRVKNQQLHASGTSF
jgi:hypothetical protein